MKFRKWCIVAIVIFSIVAVNIIAVSAAEKRPYKIGCIFS